MDTRLTAAGAALQELTGFWDDHSVERRQELWWATCDPLISLVHDTETPPADRTYARQVLE
jgi:hypothetical protein